MIVALCGPAGCGKTTVAKELSLATGAGIVSFALPMKHMIEELLEYYGYDEDERCRALYTQEGKAKPLSSIPGSPTPRHLLQTIGTEWGRDQVHPDIGVSAALAQAGRCSKGAIFDDCRFNNEAAAVRLVGGVVVHLRRKAILGIPHHASETGVFAEPRDLHVVNDREPHLVAAQIRQLVGL